MFQKIKGYVIYLFIRNQTEFLLMKYKIKNNRINNNNNKLRTFCL